MILSIKHKGLKLFYEDGNGAKLPAEQLVKISRILTALDAVTFEDDIKAMGNGIHKLSGNLRELWSIKTSANYRITFKFEEGDITEIDYLDYH